MGQKTNSSQKTKSSQKRFTLDRFPRRLFHRSRCRGHRRGIPPVAGCTARREALIGVRLREEQARAGKYYLEQK